MKTINIETNKARTKNPMKVITGPDTRWGFCNVWEPKAGPGGTGVPKYSVTLIIPKDDEETVSDIRSAIFAAYQDGERKLRGRSRFTPAITDLKLPLHDGDLERPNDPAYAYSYYVIATNRTAPGIVDADLRPITTHSEIYSGVYGRASISFYAFYGGSADRRGIACSLNNLQKIRDGKPLGTRPTAAEDFKDCEEGECDQYE